MLVRIWLEVGMGLVLVNSMVSSMLVCSRFYIVLVWLVDMRLVLVSWVFSSMIGFCFFYMLILLLVRYNQ